MDPGGGAGAAAKAVQASAGSKRKRNNLPSMPVIAPTIVPPRKIAAPAGSGRGVVAIGPENVMEPAGWVPAGPLNPENERLRFSAERRTTRIDPEGRGISLRHPVTGEKFHHVTRTRRPANVSTINILSRIGPRRKNAIVSAIVADAAQKGNTIVEMAEGIDLSLLDPIFAEPEMVALTEAQKEFAREQILQQVINKLIQHYKNLNANNAPLGGAGAAGGAGSNRRRRRRNRRTRRKN